MTLAGPRSRRQAEEVHTELGEARRITQFSSRSGKARLVIGRGIHRADDGFQSSDINFLGHAILLGPTPSYFCRWTCTWQTTASRPFVPAARRGPQSQRVSDHVY